MKVIAIGDVHGRTLWEEIIKKEIDADKIVFNGDYFDSHYDITPLEQIENFKKILKFKQDNQEKVVLLIGNHDFHYLKGVSSTYSGFSQEFYGDINKVLQPAVDSGLMQASFIHEHFLFTHAGVTKTWVRENNIDLSKLQTSINDKFVEDLTVFDFTVGPNMDRSGNDITQTPIWVRIPSLLNDGLDGYVHVIGHTTLERLAISRRIIGIDCIGTSGEYLEIINLKPLAKKL